MSAKIEISKATYEDRKAWYLSMVGKRIFPTKIDFFGNRDKAASYVKHFVKGIKVRDEQFALRLAERENDYHTNDIAFRCFETEDERNHYDDCMELANMMLDDKICMEVDLETDLSFFKK